GPAPDAPVQDRDPPRNRVRRLRHHRQRRRPGLRSHRRTRRADVQAAESLLYRVLRSARRERSRGLPAGGSDFCPTGRRQAAAPMRSAMRDANRRIGVESREVKPERKGPPVAHRSPHLLFAFRWICILALGFFGPALSLTASVLPPPA